MAAESKPELRRVIRLGLSVLVVVHLTAVFVPPLAFQTRGPLGPSPAVRSVFGPLEGYCQFLYIDRGYAFFAPDPGPSHLVQAAITSESGTTERIYPDREQQWPRLLYHRHFMITEYLEEIYEPPGPPPELFEIDRPTAEQWQQRRARYEHVRQSVVDHLRHVNPGSEVAIRRLEHLIPNLADFRREPIELTDTRLYQVLLDEPIDIDFTDELAAPDAGAETIPPPTAEVAPEVDASPDDGSSPGNEASPKHESTQGADSSEATEGARS